ncbi:unnamed protein product [Didymodactylos carnosus]|uniref:Plasma membrane ATPase n=1 Tax=Didymodactylos carnosus TaxID=1234261 RepID=A0A813VEE4_9BILA|nr:unnamed protein product [Didymodactylos carnosus]CAF0843601.1 unnamed protein product [Didymodactylos carnosus]CAF3624245.1 unnamed protein product [Didymodactylos carnosus]CAF3628703.1 unnamed protein product [Didymodactylos carnosus]
MSENNNATNGGDGKKTTVDIPEGGVKSIRVEDLYDKEKFDLSTMDSSDFGHNRLEQKEQSPILQFLLFMWNPLSWVMEAAALVAIALSNGGGQPPDWEDFVGIVLLLLANSIIGFVEQRKAGNAVKALMEALAPSAKVKRNGKWETIDAADLVPGDIISVKLGDIIPADGRLISAHGSVSIDQAALTGESLPVTKEIGDEIFSGSTCKQGEADAIVIGTGTNTFFGRAAKLVGGAHDETGHLQHILGQIGWFCIGSITIFVIAEILVMYAGFRYAYRRGINNILVLLIGGIPIAMPTVLSVTLAIGAKQLSEHKAIVTHIQAIEELAAVSILCSDKTGTLTLNKLVIDKDTIKQYSDVTGDDIIRYAAYACRSDNQDAIDACVTTTVGNPKNIRDGIEELFFKPFNPTDKRTEITYKLLSNGSVHRVTKGMSHFILDLCTRDKDAAQIKQLNDDVDEFARRGLRALAVAIDQVPSGTADGEGLGFKLIGLLPIYDPPRSDTKETIERAIELGVKVKMITGDQLAIAKETGRRLGMGDNMFPSTILKDGPPPGSPYKDVDDLVLHADGFAGVYPEHKYAIVELLQKMDFMVAMTGDGVNDAPALAKANVGVAVAEASDAARSAADIVLTEPGLSVIIEAILGSRQIFQRMRNYAIYTCSVTIRVLVGFSVLIFAFKFDFPPFMVLILAILNDGTIMTISKDRVKPSPYPNNWNLFEIFTYAIVYGIYLAASTIAFFAVAVQTNFFQHKFGVPPFKRDLPYYDYNNDPVLHSIIYLQVSTISQGLIFITRSRGLFFTERPSAILVCAFIVAQMVATFIAVYAKWGFTNIEGIVWVWNIIWFFPLDAVKFALRAYFDPIQKRALEELTSEPSTEAQVQRRRSTIARKASMAGPPSRRSTAGGSDKAQGRRETMSIGNKYYAPQTRVLSTQHHHRNFARLLKLDNTAGVSVEQGELRRFSIVQV